jgi:hypothetical protein
VDAHDQIGLAGEVAFAREFRQHLDLTSRIGGDKGIDFWQPLMFSIDVKTSPKAGFLLVEVGKVKADIYVLARYNTNILDAELLGWEWSGIIAKAPPQNFANRGIINHCIERGLLKPMHELKERAVVLGFDANLKGTKP